MATECSLAALLVWLTKQAAAAASHQHCNIIQTDEGCCIWPDEGCCTWLDVLCCIQLERGMLQPPACSGLSTQPWPAVTEAHFHPDLCTVKLVVCLPSPEVICSNSSLPCRWWTCWLPTRGVARLGCLEVLVWARLC